MSAPQSNAGLNHALFYEGLGWSVVPAHRSVRLDDGTISCTCKRGTACDSPGKHPALVAWSQYQRRCATPEELQRWFEGEFKGYGVGIITGKVSGIFAVDVDTGPGKVGGESLDALQMMYGDLPITIEARTGGGGRHVLLQHPGTCFIATTKNTPAPGIDIRGDGGFIVVAPSLHTSGRSYLWNEHHHPQTTPVAPAPLWLVDLIKSDAPRAPGSTAAPTGTGEIVRDAFGKVIDGRERYMIGIVGAAVASYLRQHQVLPNPEWVFSEAWPAYERNVRARGASLEADHRGETLMRQKITSTLRRVASGRWKVSAVPFSEAPDAEPEPEHDPETGEIIAFPATPLFDLDLDHIPPREWLYGRELLKGFVSVLGSPGGVGKTAYTHAAGASVALGRSLLAHDLNRPSPFQAVHKTGPVWFYNLEDPADELRRRIKALLLHQKLGRDDFAHPLYVDSGRDRPLVITKRSADGTLIAAPVVNDLVAELIRRGIALLVVDPFVQSHTAEENRNEEMNLVMAEWGKVAHQARCAVWLIHHFRKGGQGGDGDSFRGAGAIQGAARVMSTLSAMSREEASKLGVDPEQRRQYVRLDNAKANMAPPADRAEWYRLVSVSIHNATQDYPEGDYVQTIEPWEPPSPWEGLSWHTIARILDRLERGPSEGERYSADRRSKERWAALVLVEMAGTSEGQAAAIIKAWIENGLLEVGQYAAPSRKGAITSCVSVNPIKAAEMRSNASAGGSDDD